MPSDPPTRQQMVRVCAECNRSYESATGKTTRCPNCRQKDATTAPITCRNCGKQYISATGRSTECPECRGLLKDKKVDTDRKFPDLTHGNYPAISQLTHIDDMHEITGQKRPPNRKVIPLDDRMMLDTAKKKQNPVVKKLVACVACYNGCALLICTACAYGLVSPMWVMFQWIAAGGCCDRSSSAHDAEETDD